MCHLLTKKCVYINKTCKYRAKTKTEYDKNNY